MWIFLSCDRTSPRSFIEAETVRMSLSRNRSLVTLGASALVAAAALFLYWVVAASDLPAVTVYRSPACSCCSDWVGHMEEAGFEVEVVQDRNLMAVKADRGVPAGLHSCHTATVGGYTVEGHVPASDVKRMLRQGPAVSGLAVAGMPPGTPGMSGTPAPYLVEVFEPDGATGVYARH